METTPVEKNERVLQRELIYIIGFAVLLVIIFVSTQQIIKWSTQFDFEGLHFTKQQYGSLRVYHYYYNWIDREGKSFVFNLYLRTDPRKNMVEVTSRPVTIDTRKVYLSLDTDSNLTDCPDSTLALGDFTLFLVQNQFTVDSGVMNETLAKESDEKYITCERKNSTEVIEFTRGPVTRVETSPLCTRVIVGPDCKIMDATERLKTVIVADAKARSQGLI